MSKVKQHFAQRVSVRLTPKHDTDGSASQKRMEVLAEINKYKVNIDRSVFINTQQEKDEIKIQKSYHRSLQHK